MQGQFFQIVSKAEYQIRVAGFLDENWSDRFLGVAIMSRKTGGTIKRIVALPTPAEKEKTSGISSTISIKCLQLAKWCSSIADGTTGWVWNV